MYECTGMLWVLVAQRRTRRNLMMLMMIVRSLKLIWLGVGGGCMRLHAFACVRACVLACLRACVLACERACVRTCVCVGVCAYARACCDAPSVWANTNQFSFASPTEQRDVLPKLRYNRGGGGRDFAKKTTLARLFVCFSARSFVRSFVGTGQDLVFCCQERQSKRCRHPTTTTTSLSMRLLLLLLLLLLLWSGRAAARAGGGY